MFSEHERRRLARIQEQLVHDDPEFVADFESSLLRFADHRDANRVGHWLCTIMMWVTVALALLQLSAGVVGGAIFMVAIATGSYLVRRYRLLPPQNL